jgi:hypothetical protein
VSNSHRHVATHHFLGSLLLLQLLLRWSFVRNVGAVSNWESNQHVPPQACFVEDMWIRCRLCVCVCVCFRCSLYVHGSQSDYYSFLSSVLARWNVDGCMKIERNLTLLRQLQLCNCFSMNIWNWTWVQ